MIKKLLVIGLIFFTTLTAQANVEEGDFLPFGTEPIVTLEKQSSETRELPSLDFYDGIIPIITNDTVSIESSLMYDDFPIREVFLDDSIIRPTIVLPTNLFNSPTVANQDSKAISGRSVFSNKTALIREGSRTVAGINGSATETTGAFSFGAGYNRGLDKAQVEDNASLFTRYDSGRFALNSQYLASSKQSLGTQYNSIKISPEVKLSDQFKVRTGFQSYTNIPLKKGEVVLVYSPSVRKYLDSLNFEVGIAHRYNSVTGFRGSELKFSTGFRF